MSNRSAAARPGDRERGAVEDREQVDQQPDHPHRQGLPQPALDGAVVGPFLGVVGGAGHPPILSMGAWTHDRSPDLTPAGRLAGPRRRAVRRRPGRARPGRRATDSGATGRDELFATHPQSPVADQPELRENGVRLLALRPRPAVHGRGPRGGARGDRGLRRRRRHGHARAGRPDRPAGRVARRLAAARVRRRAVRPAPRRHVRRHVVRRRSLPAGHRQGLLARRRRHPPGRRPQLRLPPVVPLRPAVDLSPGPARQHRSPSRSKQARGSEPTVGDLLS